MNPHLDYHDFRGYPELLRHGDVCAQLVSTYQTTFGDSDVWGETYSNEDVHHKLRDELSGHAHLRLCVDPARNSTVAAFFWAQLCGAEEVVRAIATIKFSESLATPGLLANLREAIGDRDVIYIHDFGILKEYRGRIWLTHLISPPLWEIASRSGNSRVLFWSVPGTQVSAFARRQGFKEVLVTQGMHFHLGEFSRDRDCDGINLPWQKQRKWPAPANRGFGDVAPSS